MVRHKGAKPFKKSWMPWGDRHPVARMIATGDPWFQAWCFQACTIIPVLARKSGVSAGRLRAIDLGDQLTRSELEAIAAVWGVDPSHVIASLPDPALLIE
jgi:hypothetical protein